MPHTYSEDLRWRVIYHSEFYGSSTEDTARALFVSVDFVRRMKRLFQNTGNVAWHPVGQRPRKLTGKQKRAVGPIIMQGNYFF